MSRVPRLHLKKDRDDSALRRHPWIFSGAIAKVEGHAESGVTIEVVDAGGRTLGWAAYSPSSQIKARFWSFGPEPFTPDTLRASLERALAARPNAAPAADAVRLVNAESDRLPGLIVDRYGDVLVCQLLAAGAEFWRREIAENLRELVPGARALYERSDVDVRAKEGLPPRVGRIWGDEPPEHVPIEENGARYLVDVREGHKTGFYLDQHENRDALRRHLALRLQKPEVLNAFCYTGGFGIAAWRGGAGRLTQIDSSEAALALAGRHGELNGVDAEAHELVEGNVFSVLRAFRAENRKFDAIVLDPPKFVDSRAHLEKAARGYKDINLLACQLLRAGGLLFTFSCSGLMPAELFQKIVADAALDAGRDLQLLERLGAPADHPTLLAFPEGSYLKGLACRIGD